MAVVKPIFWAALLATALGLIFEFVVPASGRIIDIGAAVCGLATWIVPLLLVALSWNKKRSSLASVGFTIYLFAVAACLSAVGLSLALLTLVFAQGPNRAWIALLEIAAFWLAVGILLYVGDRHHRQGRDVSK